jgi:uncharacterized protein (UPF0335 family)
VLSILQFQVLYHTERKAALSRLEQQQAKQVEEGIDGNQKRESMNNAERERHLANQLKSWRDKIQRLECENAEITMQNKIIKETVKFLKETVDIQDARWEKLKEWIEKSLSSWVCESINEKEVKCVSAYQFAQDSLQKMQELESGGEVQSELQQKSASGVCCGKPPRKSRRSDLEGTPNPEKKICKYCESEFDPSVSDKPEEEEFCDDFCKGHWQVDNPNPDSISLCEICHCMTKTLNGRCGKCNEYKSIFLKEPKPQARG